MKKIKYLILLMIILLSPVIVQASTVSKVEIQGTNEVYVGSELSLSFYIGVSDLKKGTNDSLGISGITYKIDFDDSIFNIVDIPKTDSFKTEIYNSNNEYYVVSYVDETNGFRNKCVDDVLYCTDYIQSITFYAKDTTIDKTQIKISDVNVLLFPVNSEYDEKDLTIINGNKNSYTINIKKSEIITDNNVPQSIVTKSSSNNALSSLKSKVSEIKSETSSSTNNSVIENKDFNNNLALLEILGYQIDFQKDKLEYSINISKDVNELSVNALAESNSSKVEIRGNEDLKANNYQVIIDVISENNDKKTYIIKAIISNDSIIKEEKKGIKYKLSEKTKKVLKIAGILLFIIILIAKIISYKNDKKLSKKLDEML